MSRDQSSGPVGDYSLVKDTSGQVHGFWLASKADAENVHLLLALAFREGLPESTTVAVSAGDYRVVPNTYDAAGGCFIMFGSALAPGE